jgi:lysophospholipase L1-like esterase
LETHNVTRRDFLLTSAAVAAASQAPIGTISDPPQGPAQRGTIVVFQGDSITEAGRNLNAKEPNSAGGLGNGYPLLVASAVLADRAKNGFQFYNRGVSGNKVPDLEQRWATDALELQPDVLSILVGVNDFWHTLTHGYTGTVQDYEQQLTGLLDETRRALPAVRLIVFEPFVLRTGAVDERWFPEFDNRRAVAARVADRARATFVPLQKIFDKHARETPPPPAYWASDGVHPTPAGHAIIAEQWRHATHL